jgi:hypothetical protein
MGIETSTPLVLMTCGEVAHQFKPRPVSAEWIRKLFDAGELVGFRTPGGVRLVTEDSLRRLLERRAARIAA